MTYHITFRYTENLTTTLATGNVAQKYLNTSLICLFNNDSIIVDLERRFYLVCCVHYQIVNPT